MTFAWCFSAPLKGQQIAIIAVTDWDLLPYCYYLTCDFSFFRSEGINPAFPPKPSPRWRSVDNITRIPLSLLCQSTRSAPSPRRLSDSSSSPCQRDNLTHAAGPCGRTDKHLLTSLCLSVLHIPGAFGGLGAARDTAAPPVRAAEGRSGILL